MNGWLIAFLVLYPPACAIAAFWIIAKDVDALWDEIEDVEKELPPSVR